MHEVIHPTEMIKNEHVLASVSCLHQVFEIVAAQKTEQTALVFGNMHMSYGELNRRANQLAHRLRRLGVGPDVPVIVFMERSFDLIVAVLGVLKAGGAYVPIDPHYPQERLVEMFRQCGAPVVLTQEHLQSLLPLFECHVLALPEVSDEATTNLNGELTTESLAYIIFTSGTTGSPKGVTVPHRAIYNTIRWTIQEFSMKDNDVFLLRAPFSFDASVWEIFTPLLTGAKLVIAEPNKHLDVEYVIRLIFEHRVTVLQGVPTVLQLLVESPNFETCRSLRYIFSGAEPLLQHLQVVLTEMTGAEVVNVYGPTEAAVDTVFYRCSANEHGPMIPIGRPIAATQLYVLNDALEPVGVGEVGELYIGGHSVARGYLDQPIRTAERFLPNRFNAQLEGQLFKTGDLVRYLQDDNLEFVGRIDHQVKIRGFRVELAEIEAILLATPGVRQAIVKLWNLDQGAIRLVAYVVRKEQSVLTEDELRGHVVKVLPEYMIPDDFVFLEEIPLLPNGKQDRNLLPELVWQQEHEKSELEMSSEIERQIASIWSEVLLVKTISPQDNFFELGGNSLQVMRTLSKLRKTLKFEISLANFYKNPTVQALANLLSQTRQ